MGRTHMDNSRNTRMGSQAVDPDIPVQGQRQTEPQPARERLRRNPQKRPAAPSSIHTLGISLSNLPNRPSVPSPFNPFPATQSDALGGAKGVPFRRGKESDR